MHKDLKDFIEEYSSPWGRKPMTIWSLWLKGKILDNGRRVIDVWYYKGWEGIGHREFTLFFDDYPYLDLNNQDPRALDRYLSGVTSGGRHV